MTKLPSPRAYALLCFAVLASLVVLGLTRLPSLSLFNGEGQGRGLLHDRPSPLQRVYIAPDDHTDYMWTADARTCDAAFVEMIDYYLGLADKTRDEPAAFQSRWNCDGNYWVWVYEKTQTPDKMRRLADRIRDGHISVPLNALVSCYGAMPAEAVLRGMYYGGSLQRRYGFDMPLAIAMENQTMPYGLGALWAGCGARYSWKGICGSASKIPDSAKRRFDVYWWPGPDGSRILMKWNSMYRDNKSIGGYAEARDPAKAIKWVTRNKEFRANNPYPVTGVFGKGWDDLKTMTPEFVTVAKSATTPSRKVIVSSEVDYFKDLEKTSGDSLPSLACSFGNEWDLYCASLAETTARVKRAVESLRGAEALAALVSRHNPRFMDGSSESRQCAWMSLGLYWEHNWTADGPVSRDARRDWENELCGQIEKYARELTERASASLGAMISGDGPNPRFYIFNPLNWPRTDYADLPCSTTGLLHAIDLVTGEIAPSQRIEGLRLRVLAEDVPSVGYKVIELRPGPAPALADAATVIGNVVENPYYRLTVSSQGAITSLVDKTRGSREMAREIEGRRINDFGPGSGRLRVENAGPVSVTVVAACDAPLRRTARITLLRNSDRIELRNDIEQNFADIQTWAFAFNLGNPDTRHEEVGAVVRAKLLNEGGHYSPRNARYDWLTLNHFVDMSSGRGGVTLSNSDCCFMRLGDSTTRSLDSATSLISVLAGGQVDGPNLGIPGQGGASHFTQRFALRTHGGYDAASAMRFALESQNPFLAGRVDRGGQLPGRSYSFLATCNPKVLLWSLKPSEDGNGARLMARLWNLSPATQTLSLRLPDGPIASAQRATHLETPLGPARIVNGALQETFAPWRMRSFLLAVPESHLLAKK